MAKFSGTTSELKDLLRILEVGMDNQIFQCRIYVETLWVSCFLPNLS